MGVLNLAAKHFPVSTTATVFSYASPRSLPSLPTLAQLREHAEKATAALPATPTISQLPQADEKQPVPVKKESSRGVTRPKEIPAADSTPPPRYAMKDPSAYSFTLASYAPQSQCAPKPADDGLWSRVRGFLTCSR